MKKVAYELNDNSVTIIYGVTRCYINKDEMLVIATETHIHYILTKNLKRYCIED